MGDEELMWMMMILEVLTYGNCWFIRLFLFFFVFLHGRNIKYYMGEKNQNFMNTMKIKEWELKRHCVALGEV